VKVKLNAAERLAVMQLFPDKGNFLNLKIIRIAIDTLGLDGEEQKKLGVIFKDGKIDFGKLPYPETEIELETAACDIISSKLEELDKLNTLEQRHFTLFEKFVKGGN